MGSSARPRTAELTPVVLSRARLADLPEVSALERSCYADPWPASAFAVLPDNPRVFFTVARAEPGGRVAGYAVSWYVLDEGELANLAVSSSSRRRGIGRALLRAVLADAKERGIRELYLEVRQSNSAARELYAAHEFEEVGRRKEYYRSPVEDALILRRTLTPQLI
jgi:ribosomal-protein-alanine N-acetyltransferase